MIERTKLEILSLNYNIIKTDLYETPAECEFIDWLSVEVCRKCLQNEKSLPCGWNTDARCNTIRNGNWLGDYQNCPYHLEHVVDNGEQNGNHSGTSETEE